MPKIPDHDYSVPELEEQKLYAVTYRYEVDGDWFADTWNITGYRNIGEALETVDKFCEGNLNSGNWSAYDISNINCVGRVG